MIILKIQSVSKRRRKKLILIKVHDYIDNYSGEITAPSVGGVKINKLNFRCPDMNERVKKKVS
jgi:hypothetical protein